jgi:esterase
VLILTGSDDPIITPDVAATVVARFDSTKTTVTEIEKSSHWPHIEQPSVVAAQISRFLARNLATEATGADARHG